MVSGVFPPWTWQQLHRKTPQPNTRKNNILCNLTEQWLVLLIIHHVSKMKSSNVSFLTIHTSHVQWCHVMSKNHSGCYSNYDSPRTILECLILPQTQHTPWQSIPGGHSNSDSPGIIMWCHSYDSPGTILGYSDSAPAYPLIEYPRTS